MSTPAVAGGRAGERAVRVEQVMGMPVSLHVRGPEARDDDRVGAALDAAAARLHEADALFSTYRPDSAVSRVRRGEIALGDAPAAVREVAALCDEARERTDGWFDAWLPERPGGPRLFEPTGLVKGWAVEAAAGDLRQALPQHDVLVDAGGDVALACNRTDTPDWTVGIEDPRARTQLLATLPLRTGGVATSGTAARGEHVLDPATGAPGGAGLLSVTVVGPSLLRADVYATAAFARGAGCDAWLATLTGHVALVVAADGTTRTVRGGSPTA